MDNIEAFAAPQDIEAELARITEELVIEESILLKMKVEHTLRSALLAENKEKLARRMQAAGLKSIKLDNGLTPSVATNMKFFKQAGVDDDMLFGFLRANNLGGIIKETVHFQTMQSALSAFRDGGGELPPDIINESEILTVRMNGKAAFLAGRK
jgi:hypothetical protein